MTLIKRSPSSRSYDSIIGKFFGYLSHEDWYWGRERDCSAWVWFLPDWFPISSIKSLIVSIFQKSYDDGYQQAYNNGADYGNNVNDTVFGWVDKARTDLTKYTDKVKADLDSVITSIKSKISSLDSLISDARSKIATLETSIKNFETRLADAKASVDKAVADAKTALDRVNKALSEIDTAKTKIKDMLADLSNKTTQIDELFTRVKNLESQIGVKAPTEGKSIWDILLGR